MKRGFTLVEILVSVVLLGFISIFTAATIQQTKSNNALFENKLKQDQKIERFVDILYHDIFQSKAFNVKTYKKYSILELQSKNTIHGIQNPHIVWLVLKENNTLIRLESAKKITLPIRDTLKRYIFVDKVIEDCDSFSINRSHDKKYILSYIQIKNYKPILFEIKKFSF